MSHTTRFRNALLASAGLIVTSMASAQERTAIFVDSQAPGGSFEFRGNASPRRGYIDFEVVVANKTRGAWDSATFSVILDGYARTESRTRIMLKNIGARGITTRFRIPVDDGFTMGGIRIQFEDGSAPWLTAALPPVPDDSFARQLLNIKPPESPTPPPPERRGTEEAKPIPPPPPPSSIPRDFEPRPYTAEVKSSDGIFRLKLTFCANAKSTQYADMDGQVVNETGAGWDSLKFRLVVNDHGQDREIPIDVGDVSKGQEAAISRLITSYVRDCGFDVKAAVFAGGNSHRKAEITEASARKKAAEQASARAKQEAADKAQYDAYVAMLPRLDNGRNRVYLGDDRKCSTQIVAAMNQQGIEERVLMDLFKAYGCAWGVARNSLVEVKREDEGYALVQVFPYGRRGWVPKSWLKPQ